MTQILIVDDEDGLRELLEDAMRLAGFESVAAADGESADAWLKRNSPDLVVLDVNLPKLDGFGVLKNLRERGAQVPVILLTARGDKSDITHGLKLGADDYLAKPFSLEELILRIRAILRRTQGDEDSLPDSQQIGPFTLDVARHEIHFNAEHLELSPTEFNLLEYLLVRPNRVVSKAALLDDVWGMGFSSNTAVVDTYVSYLRRKLSAVGFEGLKTIRGVGIQLVIEK